VHCQQALRLDLDDEGKASSSGILMNEAVFRVLDSQDTFPGLLFQNHQRTSRCKFYIALLATIPAETLSEK
jgi:hypothetical protein